LEVFVLHEFVDAHREEIYARNLPDKGCVFTVDLPRLPVLALAIV
jgi:signal transduction histidine kinase